MIQMQATGRDMRALWLGWHGVADPGIRPSSRWLAVFDAATILVKIGHLANTGIPQMADATGGLFRYNERSQ